MYKLIGADRKEYLSQEKELWVVAENAGHLRSGGRPLAEYAKQGFELARFKIQSDYCIANLLAENGQWGRVIVWDYTRNCAVHLTSAPFARCSTAFGRQVLTLYLYVPFPPHPS